METWAMSIAVSETSKKQSSSIDRALELRKRLETKSYREMHITTLARNIALSVIWKK